MFSRPMPRLFPQALCASAVRIAAAAAAASIGGALAEPAVVEHPSFTPEQLAFFESEVRPILTENCIKCHGGTDARGKVKVRSNLQLISRRGLVLGGDHGPAVDLENPSGSFLLEMVSYKDPDHSMPPSGKLKPEQIATLEKWLGMGAPWSPEDIDLIAEVEHDGDDNTVIDERTQNFWSHRPMVRPEVPEVDDPAWAGNPIDAFIYAKLAENGLKPNPVAPPESLARRAFYNLTGLAPDAGAVEAFAADPSPEAWRALVDDLLARPQYGERWARHWLDLVRYAESNGFERDSMKGEIWRYRDWVIDAFNNDLPYDDFILQQLAGDEVDEVGVPSRIATGYHRLMQWDDEPADPLQHKYDVLDDNVRTTTEGFLAMTMGCARCHDHKGDPMPQEDYYAFMAFFHGITNMDKNKVIETVGDPVSKERAAQAQRQREEKIADLEGRIARLEKLAREKFAAADDDLRGLANGPATLADPVLVADHRTREQRWHYTTDDPGEGWSAVGFRADEAGWNAAPAPFGTNVPGEKPRTPWRTKQIWLQTTFHLAEVPPGLGLKLRAYHDEDIEVFLNGQPVAQRGGYVTQYVEVPLADGAAGFLQTGRNVLSVHVKHGGGGQFFDCALSAEQGGAAKSLDIAALIRTRGDEVFTAEQIAAYRGLKRELRQVKAAPPATDGAVKAMVVQERGPRPEPMHVHIRGNAAAKGDAVEPGFPQILGGGAASIPEPADGQKTSGRRRVLAEWIASPDNRRTARVMVNRIWQHHFGRGICPTPSDFGYLGELPTHPELLDWLATEFVRRGWSVKEMQRLIMSSRTYRMSSAAQPEALAADPANNLFWRFNMRRLSAEEIRDSILAVTGELNLKSGGPSMYPKLDEAVLATSSTKAGKWGNSPPEEQNRRSIYITIKRSLKPPELTAFDFADTDAPCPVRFTTTVPTQALDMLNSRFVNDRAEVLAGRLKAEHPGDLAAQVRAGLELVTCKEPDAESLAIAKELTDKLQGEHGLDPDTALERFCLVALNLNEFLFLD